MRTKAKKRNDINNKNKTKLSMTNVKRKMAHTTDQTGFPPPICQQVPVDTKKL